MNEPVGGGEVDALGPLLGADLVPYRLRLLDRGDAHGDSLAQFPPARVRSVHSREPDVPLRIAIPDMVSPSYFPAIAAVELGFFKSEGLDAVIELVFPVTKTFEELREGRLDFAGGAAHAPLYAFRDWTGCRLICALSQNMYWFLVVRKDIGAKRGELRALKGLRIGAAPGPADGLKRMLVESGIDPEREVNIAP